MRGCERIYMLKKSSQYLFSISRLSGCSSPFLNWKKARPKYMHMYMCCGDVWRPVLVRCAIIRTEQRKSRGFVQFGHSRSIDSIWGRFPGHIDAAEGRAQTLKIFHIWHLTTTWFPSYRSASYSSSERSPSEWVCDFEVCTVNTKRKRICIEKQLPSLMLHYCKNNNLIMIMSHRPSPGEKAEKKWRIIERWKPNKLGCSKWWNDAVYM